MQVLGIEVSPALLHQWIDWLAPDRQPFYLTAKQISSWGLTQDDTEPDRQQRDTYPAAEVRRSTRTPGWHLSRHTLHP